jgi:transposase
LEWSERNLQAWKQEMAKAYSMDLRERVMDACHRGKTLAQVSEQYAVSESFVEKLKRRFRDCATLEPRPHAGGRKSLLADYDEVLRAHMTAKPDTTLEELRSILGVPVALSTLWNRLSHLGLTFKKNVASSRARSR